MKTLREFFDSNHIGRKRSNKRPTEDSKQRGRQPKKDGDQSIPSIKPLHNAEKISEGGRFDPSTCKPDENTYGSDTTADSGKASSNKTFRDLLNEGQAEPRPLQELLHIKEPLLLWELLQVKEETTSLCNEKVSELKKAPDLKQKKHRKSHSASLIQEVPSKLEVHTADVQASDFELSRFAPSLAMTPECTRYSAGTVVTPTTTKSMPSSPLRSPKKSRNQTPLMLLEAACKVLKPGEETYCHFCLPLVKPFSGKNVCVTDATDHHHLATKEEIVRDSYSNDHSVVIERCRPSHSFKMHCTRKEYGIKLLELSCPPKRKEYDISGHEGSVNVLKANELIWDLDDCILELGQNVSENPHRFQNQMKDKFASGCTGFIQRARSLRERMSPPTCKTILHRSYSLKENDSGENSLFFQQDNNANREKDIATSRPNDTLEGKPAVKENAACDVLSPVGCNGLNRIMTLKDMLSTSIEDDIPILDRECMSVMYEQTCHSEPDYSESTCHSSKFGCTMVNESQVILHLDHKHCEGALSPTLQKKLFFDGVTSCHMEGGSGSLSECNAFEGDGQPSPVSILDSQFIDESPSPEKAESIPDSEKQLRDREFFRHFQSLEITDLETSDGTFYGSCCTEGNEYFLLERVVDSLLYMENDTENPCPEDASFSPNAHSPECYPGKRIPSKHHFPNFYLFQEETYQDSKPQGDDFSGNNGPKGCRVLEELSDSQVLVDCVTEALELLYSRESCLMLGRPCLLGQREHSCSKRKLLQKIFQTICSWSGQSRVTIEGLVEKDVNSIKWMFSSIKSELLEIGLEIEYILFEMLIGDAVRDMLDLEMKEQLTDDCAHPL